MVIILKVQLFIININMKNFLRFIKINIISFINSTWYAILAAMIGTIVGFIFGFNIGVLTFFGLGLSVVLFVWFRQLWWWISNTEDRK